MVHLPELVQDLAYILMTAAVVTLVFKKLKQPVVLGYLLAGFLVGPHVPLVPTITETDSIKIWAEIGVIFLLFSLGLEFSFKKLTQVGRSAAITGMFQIAFMVLVGFVAGRSLGWNTINSLFLGGMLSISSTTIIFRAFDELGLKGQKFVSLVYGVLIVEDLVAILLLVLLSTMAVTNSLTGGDLAFSALRLGFFLILWFMVGIYIIPQLLSKIRPLLSDETLLIVSIGLCLGMVLLASSVGFSPALGAFIMGSLLAETKELHRIEAILVPVRDLFAAVFFVSVGMLIDPAIISQHLGLIFFITIILIFGKLMSSSLGALLAGESIKTSTKAGLSLAQIGEFSFIIATLGLSLGVLNDYLYPVIVTVSAITTFVTPYMIKSGEYVSQLVETKIPEPINRRLIAYQKAVNHTNGEGAISIFMQAYGYKILLNLVLLVAITQGLEKFAAHRIKLFIDSEVLYAFVMVFVSLTLTAPFVWGIVLGSPSKSLSHKIESLHKLKRLQFGISILRIFVGASAISFIVSKYANIQATSTLVFIMIVGSSLFLSRFAEPFYNSFENRFLKNLNENELNELEEKKSVRPEIAPWDATLAEFIVSPDSDIVGKTLMSSKLKERFGVTIALIERGHKVILAPKREDLLLPADKLFLIGTDEQLSQARQCIESVLPDANTDDLANYGLEPFSLQESSYFVGKPIRECGLREKVNGLIVGIERNGQRILSPDSSMVLAPNDLIWIVGDKKMIRTLSQNEA